MESMPKDSQRTGIASQRLLGGVAAAGPLVFTVAWAIASTLQGDYSVIRDDESALAATDAAHPWITVAGDALLGIGTLALGIGLARSLSGRQAAVGCGLLLTAGLAIIVQAFAREDCQFGSCIGGAPSWHQTVHDLGAVVAFFALLGAAFVFWRVFRRDRYWQSLAVYSLVTAGAGLLLLIVSVATEESAVGGLTQRIFLTVPLAWIVVVGLRLRDT